MATTTEDPTTGAAARRLSKETRRSQIVETARRLYERNGIEHTSVKDITEEVGVTRSLFYHYFTGKDDVTDAILENYVDSFIETVREWNEGREFGNVHKALLDCVDLLTDSLASRDTFRSDLLKTQNAVLYQKFSERVAEALAHYLTETTGAEYAKYHKVEVKHLYESFYLLLIGLFAFMRRYPDTPKSVIADLISDTLHLDIDSDPAKLKRLDVEA